MKYKVIKNNCGFLGTDDHRLLQLDDDGYEVAVAFIRKPKGISEYDFDNFLHILSKKLNSGK